ncbi:MAG TPA: hypothetical protein VHH11_10360 [Gammaproteobacteria bacterium]|nr:hypothetical protein [Gammaproteobacteria bacterium]
MAIYVNKSGGFEQAEPVARECPHCGAHAQLLPAAIPSFAELARTQPRNVGLVFRCAACGEPRFVRAAVRSIDTERVELAPNLVEIERPREKFQFGYLPASVELLLREALECYTAGAHNAFASMCRRAVRMALSMADADASRRWRDGVADVLRIAEVEAGMAHALKDVLFGDQGEPPTIGPDESAVLIEVVKDLFYQHYVRTAKLRATLKMRRFFARESNVTPIDRGRRELA